MWKPKLFYTIRNLLWFRKPSIGLAIYNLRALPQQLRRIAFRRDTPDENFVNCREAITEAFLSPVGLTVRENGKSLDGVILTPTQESWKKSAESAGFTVRLLP